MKYVGIYWTLFAPLMKKSIAKRFDRDPANKRFIGARRNIGGCYPARMISAPGINYGPLLIIISPNRGSLSLQESKNDRHEA